MINLLHLLPQDLIEGMNFAAFQKGLDIYVDNRNTHGYLCCITVRE